MLRSWNRHEQLGQNSGSAVRITEIHELIEPPRRIFCSTCQNDVRILSVIDGRRSIEEILYRKVIDGKFR